MQQHLTPAHADIASDGVTPGAIQLPANGLPHKRSLYLGMVDDFGKVAELMERYKVNMCCVDHEPDGRLARSLAEKFPGRVYLAHFITPRSETVFKVNPEMRTAGVRRTDVLDAVFDSIRQQRNLLPMEKPPGYVKQMQTQFARLLQLWMSEPVYKCQQTKFGYSLGRRLVSKIPRDFYRRITLQIDIFPAGRRFRNRNNHSRQKLIGNKPVVDLEPLLD